METLRIIGSLLLVFGLMGAVLWGLRRMQMKIGVPVAGRRLQVLESVSVGPRQKIALVRVDGHEVLVGLSAGQMTALGQWPAPQQDASGPSGSRPEGADKAAAQPGEESFPMTAQALLERESRHGR